MEYFTVKEAAAKTGKSASSIRRILYPIIEAESHPDRVHILPSVEDALQLRIKGENFPWKISDDLLLRAVPIETPSQKGSSESSRSGVSNAEGELLNMLRGELTIKNQQIAQQAELISKQADLVSGLSERLREVNLLMATLQQRLALPDGRDEKTVDATVTKSVPSKEKAEKTPKAEKGSAKTEKVRNRFFPRFFS